jgi:hypothetical protein
MNAAIENHFESIESAQEFVALLAATIKDAKRDLEGDVAREELNQSRRLDALRLALYNLKKLDSDLNRCRRVLNDLRTLRRLLFEERAFSGISNNQRLITSAAA